MSRHYIALYPIICRIVGNWTAICFSYRQWTDFSSLSRDFVAHHHHRFWMPSTSRWDGQIPRLSAATWWLATAADFECPRLARDASKSAHFNSRLPNDSVLGYDCTELGPSRPLPSIRQPSDLTDDRNTTWSVTSGAVRAMTPESTIR